PPPPRMLYACEKLNEAKAILYSEDRKIIERIAGEGWSLERCASEFWGRLASKLDRTRVGDRLRIGLDHVKTLMKRMGIEALYRRPRTTKPEPGHKVYPCSCARPVGDCGELHQLGGSSRRPSRSQQIPFVSAQLVGATDVEIASGCITFSRSSRKGSLDTF